MAQYIVVGGGSAGCVVASRLTENRDVDVVLFEEGPRDSNPYIHLPVTYYKTSQGNLVKRYPWQPEPGYSGPANPTMVQASILGGGSSVNAMVYVRGVPQDYDSFAEVGATGWSYADVLPYFRRSESNDRFCNEAHGNDGPLAVSDQRYTHPLSKVWVQACQASGLKFNPDFNSGDQEGTGFYQINARNGRRCSATVAYLRPAERRKNLKIRVGVRVLRLLIEKGRAVGVEYLENGSVKQMHAEREVILCAGSINSPRLLMISGVGPADHLREKGINVHADIPGVGQNLQDHIEVSLISELERAFSYDKYKKLHWQTWAGLQYALFRSGPVVSNVVEGGAFFRSSLAEGRPDLQFCFLPGAGVEEGVDTTPGGNGCTLNICQTRPKSVGFVSLTSADPLANPYIQPNYLQEQHDVEVMADGVQFGLEVMEQDIIARHVRSQFRPSDRLDTRDALHAFVKKEAHAALHPVGTCRIGSDDMAVVDSDLRVQGVEGLRVADCSVMPNLCAANTNAAAIMIGEKASDHIRGFI
jgi:choline dehydrogenase